MRVTGSLQTKPNSKKLYMVLYYNKKYKWISTKLDADGNKRRAEAMLKEKIRKIEDKLSSELEDDILVSDLVKKWLKIKKYEVKENTYTSYLEIINNHILNYFNNYKASEITTPIINKYYAEKFSDGMVRGTLEKHRTILRGALDYAVDILAIISSNPAMGAKLPKNKNKRLPTYYNAEQLQILFNVLEGESIEIPAKLAVIYALTRSEVLGLKWSSINFKKKTIRIEHTITRNGTDVIADNRVKRD